MLNVVSPTPFLHQDFLTHLDEIARQGARRKLIEAAEAEVADYVSRHRVEVR